MPYRSTRLPLCILALSALASPVAGQTIRQVALNTATGEIDRRYLPSDQTFDFLIRAAAELREFRAAYRKSCDEELTIPEPWIRREGTKARDATIRIDGLEPGDNYRFTFILVRRPTGNEARLIEAGVLDALRDAFRAQPNDSLDTAVAVATSGVKAALTDILPRAVPVSESPLTGDAGALKAALETRGIDVLHSDYRRQLAMVEALRDELQVARGSLARARVLARTIDTIGKRLERRGSFAELGPALDACRQVRDSSALAGPASIQTETDQLALLDSLKQLDAGLGSCRGLLRDVRLPRYAAIGPAGGGQVADLLLPVADRLEALRSSTERLVSLWRKREGALGQVATDIRRTLDTRVTIADTLTASFDTAAEPSNPPSTTLGLALLGTYAPCSLTDSCIRIVPAMALSFKLRGLVGVEAGLTLADTDAAGRTRHLFWFTSGMVGPTVRLGANGAQRVGAGALILRRAAGSDFDSFQLGGYVSFTLFDLRL
jgi:hypothetical protein